MGFSLGPVLANIIMTELDNIIVKDLVDKSLIKVYMRYVDDTLLLVKEKDVKVIHDCLNCFDQNIKFTLDKFPDGNSILSTFRLTKIIQASITNQHILGSTHIYIVTHHAPQKHHG